MTAARHARPPATLPAARPVLAALAVLAVAAALWAIDGNAANTLPPPPPHRVVATWATWNTPWFTERWAATWRTAP